jgi:Tannase and feruloyl esterase
MRLSHEGANNHRRPSSYSLSSFLSTWLVPSRNLRSHPLARAAKLYNATSFDLRAFKARGGKMLMWHGLSDASISATSSIGYYEGVEKLIGGGAQTRDFSRLFLIPGVHHCVGGPGLTEFDALTLLENWVEKGQPPDVMIASRMANGVTD